MAESDSTPPEASICSIACCISKRRDSGVGGVFSSSSSEPPEIKPGNNTGNSSSSKHRRPSLKTRCSWSTKPSQGPKVTETKSSPRLPPLHHLLQHQGLAHLSSRVGLGLIGRISGPAPSQSHVAAVLRVVSLLLDLVLTLTSDALRTKHSEFRPS